MKRFAPATERNREPLLAVLKQELPEAGLLLEIAAGSGEHAVFFASHFPQLQWQPSDPDAEALASIAAWRDEEGSANLLPPIQLDATETDWPMDLADAILCVNMVHISPWEASEGLFAAAGRMLCPQGRHSCSMDRLSKLGAKPLRQTWLLTRTCAAAILDGAFAGLTRWMSWRRSMDYAAARAISCLPTTLRLCGEKTEIK